MFFVSGCRRNSHVGAACLLLSIAFSETRGEETDTEARTEPSSFGALRKSSHERDETPATGSWWTWERATGDWGGARTQLIDNGIDFHAAYIADFWNNTSGGLNTSDAHAYLGLVDVSLTFDTAKLSLWDNGTFFIDFQHLHGRSISENDVGDLQTVNNADATPFTQVAEFWYEHRLFDDTLRLKIGKMDTNADFAYVDHGLEFIHSSPGTHPTIPMPTYPDQALGAAIFINPCEWFYAGAGVYDGYGESTGRRWGFDTAFHGTDDSFTILEAGVTPTWEFGGAEYPGRYYVGGWYHSGVFEMFPTREPYSPADVVGAKRHRGNQGIYAGIDQWLWHERADESDDEQGLAMFAQFGWAPSAYNEIAQYYGGGLRYQGLIPTRDDDVTGLGLFHAKLSPAIRKLEDRHAETAIEAFHRITITPAVAIQPDLQYIINPSGAGRDALVAGIRLEITF